MVESWFLKHALYTEDQQIQYEQSVSDLFIDPRLVLVCLLFIIRHPSGMSTNVKGTVWFRFNKDANKLNVHTMLKLICYKQAWYSFCFNNILDLSCC